MMLLYGKYSVFVILHYYFFYLVRSLHKYKIFAEKQMLIAQLTFSQIDQTHIFINVIAPICLPIK